MRKIEAQMNSAIRNEVNFSKANTSVTWNDRTASVYLHGNLIARVSDTFVQILDGGWQSVTTKSRLNALLSEVTCDGGVFQKDFTWYIGSPHEDKQDASLVRNAEGRGGGAADKA